MYAALSSSALLGSEGWNAFKGLSGFTIPLYVFLVGLLNAQYTFTGYDASAHVSEETMQARISAPKGIVNSIWISMIAGVIAMVANVFLNWVLMYGHFGAQALGAVGTGLATASAQWCMAILFVIWLRWHPSYAPYDIIAPPSRPDFVRLREILALGLPIGGAMLAETALFTFQYIR